MSNRVACETLDAMCSIWKVHCATPCPPDFDGDGTVGILDLLTLLANWGPCA